MGGKVPKELWYDPALDPYATSSDLKKLTVPARSAVFVPVKVEGDENPKRTLKWWWKCESGDVDFGVRLAGRNINGSEKNLKAEDDGDIDCWPKWRLFTEYVPETRTVSPLRPSESRSSVKCPEPVGKMLS